MTSVLVQLNVSPNSGGIVILLEIAILLRIVIPSEARDL